MKKSQTLRNLFLAGVLSGLSAGVHAANTQTAVPMKASVTPRCILQTTDALAFGTYNPVSGQNLTAVGNLTLSCTKGTVVSAQPIAGGSQMNGTGGSLTYVLYTDPAFNKVWGQPEILYQAANLNGGAPYAVFLSAQSNRTEDQCRLLAQSTGGMTAWNGSADKKCFYNLRKDGQTGGSSMSSPDKFRIANIAGNTIRSGPYGTFFLPPGYVSIGTYVYNVPVGTNGFQVLSATAASVNDSIELPYYGKVMGAQNVPAGVYSDTVVVNISF